MEEVKNVINGEVCSQCGKVHTNFKRVDLGIRISKEELDSLQLIQNKLNCAAQAARPEAIPDGISESKARIFIQAAIDSLASYRWLQKDWWDSIMIKYDTPKDKNINIDFNTNDLYIMEEV